MEDIINRRERSLSIKQVNRFIMLTALLISSFSTLAIFTNQVAYAVTVPPPPAPTTSRYMSTVDPNTLYNEGCSQGSANESGVIVLDFGQPWYQNGIYGTIIFKSLAFVGIDQITTASESFLQGYWDCVPGGSASFITLAIGLNNYKGYTTTSTHAYSHGQAWGMMVNNVNDWIATQGFDSYEIAAGADDMEMMYNSAPHTRAWADGYASVSQYTYYDYGDAAGCPPYGSCNNGWTQADVTYVSWDLDPAFPLPEIYTTNESQAREWYQMSLYSYNNPGPNGHMIISGSFTQYGACQITQGCGSENNTPSQGWTQLWKRLNADSRTAQSLDYSSDITWAN